MNWLDETRPVLERIAGRFIQSLVAAMFWCILGIALFTHVAARCLVIVSGRILTISQTLAERLKTFIREQKALRS